MHKQPSNTDHSNHGQQPKNLAKPRVLVIDDSRLVRVSIKKVLGAEFEIVEAGDGEEGWEKLLDDQHIQAVLTDAGMPNLDGYGLIQRIRDYSDKRISNIPIMMITGAEVDATETREYALEIGASDFITKPFDKAQLIARVRGYTKLDQTQRNLETTEVALAEQSVMDAATNVHNRRYFLTRGEQDLAFIKRHKQELSIIAIGIDEFDSLQDKYDEHTTTELIKWTAATIKQMLRKEDTLARLDHSRFGIIAPTAGRMAAAVLCERIRKHFLTTPYTKTVISLPLSMSIGLSCYGREKPETIEVLLDVAEKRVLQAQQQGGNRTVASNVKSGKPTPPQKPLSVDKALQAIKNSEVDKLKPFLIILARQVLPILDMCNSKFDWKLDSQLSAIKEKLKQH